MKLHIVAVSLVIVLSAQAATNVVTSTADSGAGTLRNLVASSNPGDTIIFNGSLSGQTITLTSGSITLNKNLTIDGSTLFSPAILNGNHASRIFIVTNATVQLDSLILTNGWANDGNSAHDASQGGAIFNQVGGLLTVNHCTFAGNYCLGAGGGICHIGISLVLSNSTFFKNGCGYSGGAIINYGPMTVNQCTIVSNTANYAGGIMVWSGNPAANTVINQSTVVSNSGAYGAGIYAFQGSAIVSNSIVALNTDAGFNSNFGDNPGIGFLVVQSGVNYTNSNPMLSPLGNYGGPTFTMPPVFGSPAINACTQGTGFTTDQRGLLRTSGSFADIGAAEFQLKLFISSVLTTSSNATVLITLNTYGAEVGLFVNWGTTTNYESGTQFLGFASSPEVFGYVNIHNLAANTLYHFAFSATNASGAYYWGNDATNSTLPGPPPILLTGATRLGNGSFRFNFTYPESASFTVFASTNVALPFIQWTNLGAPVESPSGTFTFTDLQATNNLRRFYRVTSP